MARCELRFQIIYHNYVYFDNAAQHGVVCQEGIAARIQGDAELQCINESEIVFCP